MCVCVCVCIYRCNFPPAPVDVPVCEQDIDGCDQHCNNTEGSYYCSCDAGFKLDMYQDENGTTCESEHRFAADNHTCDSEGTLLLFFQF